MLTLSLSQIVSSVGHGAILRFYIKASMDRDDSNAKEVRPGLAHAASSTYERPPLKILVVEDNPSA